MIILFDQVPSPIGDVFVASDGECLCAVDFDEEEDRLLPLLRQRFGASVTLRDTNEPQGFAAAIEAYLSGQFNAVRDLPIDGGGSLFQQPNQCRLSVARLRRNQSNLRPEQHGG